MQTPLSSPRVCREATPSPLRVRPTTPGIREARKQRHSFYTAINEDRVRDNVLAAKEQGFSLVWENSVNHLFVRNSKIGNNWPAVVVCLGNTCDFIRGVAEWYDSPGWGAHAILCVKDCSLEQAYYIRAASDAVSSTYKDWTDSSNDYTDLALDGVLGQLKVSLPSRHWVLAGQSGGCVTAASLARHLQNDAHTVVGLVADSGVPGTWVALDDLPVAVYRFKSSEEFWNGGEVAVEWSRRGYNVVHDYAYGPDGDRIGVYQQRGQSHASFLNGKELYACVNWFWWTSPAWDRIQQCD